MGAGETSLGRKCTVKQVSFKFASESFQSTTVSEIFRLTVPDFWSCRGKTALCQNRSCRLRLKTMLEYRGGEIGSVCSRITVVKDRSDVLIVLL